VTLKIKTIDNNQSHNKWDNYVRRHPASNIYHLAGWKRVIENAYGHQAYYLAAYAENKIVGILPMIHLNHLLFGNSLISIPYFDMGGILADNEQVEKELINQTVKLAKKLKADNIELRHTCKPKTEINGSLKTNKVQMILELPESSDILMKSFKSKLRSQIKRPIKEGLQAKVGGKELIEDFYKVFLINMRDLGSPVHSKLLLKKVLEQFTENTRIILVHKNNEPYAASIVSGFKNTLENPWASSLRQYSRLSPNMLLYWTMLEYACNNKYKYFDFGRSIPDEGTYKFKKQWGAEPKLLYWYDISLNDNPDENNNNMDKSKFNKAIHYWKKLPVPVTQIIGPMIRKHIGL
jgi:FemAB-related protein (PEP-CTERM system-associated)